MTYQTLQQAAETRRSIYALNKNLPISNEEISEIVKHAVLHTPSSFNSQSTRVVVLFGEEHGKVWQFVEDALRAIAWGQAAAALSVQTLGAQPSIPDAAATTAFLQDHS